MNTKKIVAFVLPILIVVGLDRFTKHLVRTNPSYQHFTIIPGWLRFDYILNPGMALGINWLPTQTISIIAIITTLVIIGYVLYTIKRAGKGSLFFMGAYAGRACLIFMGMIVGGAIGNIIDRLILAKIEGYGGILEGHVVDFIHFTATIGNFQVFPYVFNVADASITIAIICLLIFNKSIFQLPENKEEATEPNQEESEVIPEKQKPESTTLGHRDHR